MTDAMNNTAYGRAALKKFGDVPDGFKIYFATWIGNTPEEWKSMQVRGAVFLKGKRMPFTTQTTVVTVEEIQKEKASG